MNIYLFDSISRAFQRSGIECISSSDHLAHKIYAAFEPAAAANDAYLDLLVKAAIACEKGETMLRVTAVFKSECDHHTFHSRQAEKSSRSPKPTRAIVELQKLDSGNIKLIVST